MIVVAIAIVAVISLLDYLIVFASSKLERMEEMWCDERSQAADAGGTEPVETGEDCIRN